MIKVKKSDRDCSSAVREAWELALASASCDGEVTRYNWTGGMREMFVGSGFFSWEPMSFKRLPLCDIYFDEDNHTAMCVYNDGTADLLAKLSISETGDQAGRESKVGEYLQRSQGRDSSLQREG